MIDGATVTVEGLWSLIGERIVVHSSRYPDHPATGFLHWIGPDPFVGAMCVQIATIPGSIHAMRYVPLSHVEFFGRA